MDQTSVMNKENRKNIDYSELKSEIIKILNTEKYIILASQSNKNIHIRRVTYVNSDLNIGIFKWKNAESFEEFKQNPQIGLCLPGKNFIDLQIEGSIKSIINGIYGNHYLIKLFKDTLPDTYKKLEASNNLCFFEIKPTLIKMFKPFINNSLYLYYLKIKDKNAFRIKLSDW